MSKAPGYSLVGARPFLAPRTPWAEDFPAVAIHATIHRRDAHPGYAAAKAGDAEAAWELWRVADGMCSSMTMSDSAVRWRT